MRDLNRITTTLNVIRKVWVKNPDLRLGQLLLNAGVDYQTEDDSLVELLERAYPERQLPIPTGSIIFWRENNDAGKDIGAFAERISSDVWRVNGFDNYPDSMLKSVLESSTSDWVELNIKE